MSKHAPRNPGGGAHALGRLLEAGPYRTLAVLVVAALVVAAVAIPRYRAAMAWRSTESVSAPVVHVQAPASVTVPTEVSSPVTNATPVESRPVSESPSSAPAITQGSASEKEKKVSKARVAPKWNGDWQAATAHIHSDPVEGRAASSSSVAPAAAVSPATNAEAATAPTVTMTGCLEVSVDNEDFRLTETEGANVPKARSWRSGFLKKQTAPVELRDLADPATARTYVGQRVVVTGVVENREMRVRSLRNSGKGCD